jgi:hypothetical protein
MKYLILIILMSCSKPKFNSTVSTHKCEWVFISATNEWHRTCPEGIGTGSSTPLIIDYKAAEICNCSDVRDFIFESDTLYLSNKHIDYIGFGTSPSFKLDIQNKNK